MIKMTRYNISLKYSNNGTSWSQTSTFVNASSEAEAKRIIKDKYKNAKDIKVIGKRPL